MGILEQYGLSSIYKNDIHQLNVLLEQCEQRGMPLDRQARLEAIQTLQAQQAEVLAQLQQSVPIEAKPTKRYQRSRPGAIAVTVMKRVPRCLVCLAQVRSKRHPCLTKANGEVLVYREPATVYDVVQPFVPSLKGIQTYCQVKGYTLPTKFGRVTSDEAAIRRMALKHPTDKFFPLVLQLRSINQLCSTSAGSAKDGVIKGGLPDTSRIHTTFTHNPSTLRLASEDPNLMNIPREGPMRGIFVAPPGYTFWARDFAGIEALLVGHFANSPEYQRLVKLDIHSFVTAHVLAAWGELPSGDVPVDTWPDDQLAAALAEIKRTFGKRRTSIKPLVHGGNYLLGVHEAQNNLLCEFGQMMPIVTIKRIFDVYWELFPAIKQWHRRVTGLEWVADREFQPGLVTEQEAAYQRSWLRTPFGNWCQFYNVLEWKKQPDGWQAALGSDAKKAVAFLPQSCGRFILTRAAQRLALDVQSTLRLFLHDELLGLCEDSQLARCLEESQHVMEQPIPELNGLVVKTEAKAGRSWGSMTTVM